MSSSKKRRSGDSAGKQKPGRPPASKKAKTAKPPEESEDEVGFDAIDSGGENDVANSEDVEDPFAGESAGDKRLRLAQAYLSQLQQSAEGPDAAEMDRDIIAERLQADWVESIGKRFINRADQLSGRSVTPSAIRTLRGHQLSVTCLALTDDNASVFSGSKDCSIIRWDVESGKRLCQFAGSRHTRKDSDGHTGQVLALAVSSDGRFLASGGHDRLVKIWDARSNKLIDSFKGHRDVVSALAFRRGTSQLFSGSHDRTIKLWNCDDMAYVDSLYGHQSEVTALDSLLKDRAVSTGADRSVRLWKVVEETQLVFRGHSASIDCLSMLNEERFVSGSQDGSVALWNVQKKKPVSTAKLAHGSEGGQQRLPNWISSVCALRHSDLVATGSCDGFVRLWKAGSASLSQVLEIPVVGFVNGLAFGKEAKFLVAGVGQEHRAGRWSRVPAARNGLQIVPLPTVEHDASAAEEQ